MKARFSKWAFEQLLFQFSQSHCFTVSLFGQPARPGIGKVTADRMVFSVIDDKDKAVVILDETI
jgi:hypothetical protein